MLAGKRVIILDHVVQQHIVIIVQLAFTFTAFAQTFRRKLVVEIILLRPTQVIGINQ